MAQEMSELFNSIPVYFQVADNWPKKRHEKVASEIKNLRFYGYESIRGPIIQLI